MDTNGRKNMHLTGKAPRRKAAGSKRPPNEAEAQVHYTPAKPFNRNRFLLHLATVAAVVVALIVGMSIFFKVDKDKILVSGAQKYTAWDVAEASGIRDGDGLLGLSEAKISAKICDKLRYVDSVRVGIKLPDTVYIEITERMVVYAIADTQSTWWLLNAEGRILDKTDADTAKTHTRILGVQLVNAVVGEQAVAAEPLTETDEGTVLPAISGKSRLDAAIQVISALEKNGIMGNIDTVDAADPAALTLQYEGRFRVSLGDTSRLVYKIGQMKGAIEKLGNYESGDLDASFTIYPYEVKFDDRSGAKK